VFNEHCTKNYDPGKTSYPRTSEQRWCDWRHNSKMAIKNKKYDIW